VAGVEHESARLERRDADAGATAAAEGRGALAHPSRLPVGGRDRRERRRRQLRPAAEPGVARERLADRDPSAVDAEEVDGRRRVPADVVEHVRCRIGRLGRSPRRVFDRHAHLGGALGVDDDAGAGEPDAERAVQPLVREAEVTEAEVEPRPGARACHLASG